MARVQALLVLVALAVLGVQGGGLAELLSVASVVAVSVVVLLVLRPADDAPAVGVRARVLRERARRAAFLRTRDPDAAGRVRPRAPGWGLVAG